MRGNNSLKANSNMLPTQVLNFLKLSADELREALMEMDAQV